MTVSRRAVVVLVVFIVFFSISGGVFAAQTNESKGPSGYGWQQAYYLPATWNGSAVRITGSADRQYYDYGYKNIQISGRHENYWSRDCGWWYASGNQDVYVTIYDNKSRTTAGPNTQVTTTRALGTYDYNWGDSTNEAPGIWTVIVRNQSTDDAGSVAAQFKIFVRGQLNVTSIVTSQVGSTVYVNATVKDNEGSNVNGTVANTVNVTMYVSGPNFYQNTSMDSNNDIWNGSFTTSTPGDHLITIKATDGHQYWVDGWGSTYAAVAGSFPYSFAGYGSIARVVLMILLALLLLRSGRRAMCLLIFLGGVGDR